MEKEEWNQVVKQWLKPIKYEKLDKIDVDRKYKELMQQNKIVYQALKDADPWLIKEDTKRKLGLQAQKCFCEILWALGIKPYSDLEPTTRETVKKIIKNQESLTKIGFTIKEWIAIKYKLEIRPDVTITHFGTIEIKCWNPKDTVNIKERSWNQNQSTYLCIMKHLEGTFQFIGWLYGYEVFRLPVQPKTSLGSAHYYIDQPSKKLHDPKKFMDKLYKYSKNR